MLDKALIKTLTHTSRLSKSSLCARLCPPWRQCCAHSADAPVCSTWHAAAADLESWKWARAAHARRELWSVERMRVEVERRRLVERNRRRRGGERENGAEYWRMSTELISYLVIVHRCSSVYVCQRLMSQTWALDDTNQSKRISVCKTVFQTRYARNWYYRLGRLYRLETFDVSEN